MDHLWRLLPALLFWFSGFLMGIGFMLSMLSGVPFRNTADVDD